MKLTKLVIAAVGIICVSASQAPADGGLILENDRDALRLIEATYVPGSWPSVKNAADDVIYDGWDRTFYCGAVFISKENSSGSGDVIDLDGYVNSGKWANDVGEIQWEHVVPVAFTPIVDMDCYSAEKDGREFCLRTEPKAKAIGFDLHKLVPSIGQVNQHRGHNPYGEVDDQEAAAYASFGDCKIKDTTSMFEPEDCTKGDVARISLYMMDRHRVAWTAAQIRLFLAWDQADPVNPWERERNKRIAALTGISNPYVTRGRPSARGFCDWERGVWQSIQ